MFIKKAGDNHNPNKIDNLIIAGAPGISKTSLCMQLPNALLFDLEGSSGYFKGNCDVIDIKARMSAEGIGMLTAINRTIDDVKASGNKYDYIIIDTLSVIDDLAEKVATINYKKSTQGKEFTGDSVLELAYGAGQFPFREQFQKITASIAELAGVTVIYLAHLKDSSIPKDGNQVAVTDIRLTGSLKEIFSAKQDVACLLEIDTKDKNKRILNFQKTEQNRFVKCRAEHLRNQKVLISEMTDKGLVTHWDKVFLNLK